MFLVGRTIMFCAYCGEDHEESVPFTDEHIVPYAIGGSDAFTIRVCAKSNNSFGGTVDKPFIEMPIVRWQRFLLKLSGTDGTEPSLDLGGKAQIGGAERGVKYFITDNSKRLKVQPLVTTTLIGGVEHWSVSGDREDVRRIVEGKLKSLTAKGGQMKDEDGRVLGLDNLKTSIDAREAETLNPSIHKKIQINRLDNMRFFAKLALATGHYVFGEPFSRSPRALVLRKAIHAKDIEEAGIPGAQVWPYTEAAESALAPFSREKWHTLGVVPSEPPVFVASLFGNIGALIPLAESGATNIPAISSSGRIFQIALPTREFQELTLEEVPRGWWHNE
jgi:hypothetical protein